MDGAPRPRAELERVAWVTRSTVCGVGRRRYVRDWRCRRLWHKPGGKLDGASREPPELADAATARADALRRGPLAGVANAQEHGGRLLGGVAGGCARDRGVDDRPRVAPGSRHR